MRAVFVTAIAICILAGCQTAPSGPEPKPAAVAVPPVPAKPEAPAESKTDVPAGAAGPVESAQSTQPAGPAPGSPAAKALAQKLALHSAELLQDGDEEAAKADLLQATALDPENRVAASLLRQISADPQSTLGTQSFPYTVARGESLSRVAQRFLGDIYQFYILARYNGIKVPRQVQAGQVIRVPGRAPPQMAMPSPAAPAAEAPDSSRINIPPVTPPPAPVVVPAPPPPPPPPTATERAYQSGIQALTAGDKPKALALFSQVAKLEPGYRDTAGRIDALTKELAQRYHRNAMAAFHRQDMKTAIREWDKVLEIDPNNQTAKVNRQRAIDLSKRIEQIK